MDGRIFSLEQAQETIELQKGWVNGKMFVSWYWVKAVENYQLTLLKSMTVSPVKPYHALSRQLNSADITGGRIFPPSARTIPRQPVIFLNNEVRARRKLSFHQLVKINMGPDLLYCTQLWGFCAHWFYMSLPLHLLKLYKRLLLEELQVGSSREGQWPVNTTYRACNAKVRLQTMEEET